MQSISCDSSLATSPMEPSSAVCSYFLKGHCKFGDRCHLPHRKAEERGIKHETSTERPESPSLPGLLENMTMAFPTTNGTSQLKSYDKSLFEDDEDDDILKL